MRILAVDLASKFSAACIRDAGSEVLWEGNSSEKSSFQFIATLARKAIEFEVTLVIIEDVPYSISSQAQTKPIHRLQGVVMALMHKHLSCMVFLNPGTWQNTFPGVARAPKGLSKPEGARYRVEAARKHAENYGYTAPPLVADYVASLPEGTRVLVKNTAPLEKQMTDHVDAFLITQWAFTAFTLPAEIFALMDLKGSGIQSPSI